MSRTLSFPLFLALISLTACGDDDGPAAFDAGEDARVDTDAEMPGDAGTDATVDFDAGPPPIDAGMDAAVDLDGGPAPDAGMDAAVDLDASLPDADLGLDADILDGGPAPDAAPADAGPPPDGGPPAGMCFSNADCASTEWCAYPSSSGMMYSCSAPGVCMARPEVCTGLFDPVCGCNGVTYSNACVAARNGVRVQSTGACGSSS